MRRWLIPLLPLLLCLSLPAQAEQGFAAVHVDTAADGSQTWSVSLQVLVLMTALSFLPALLMMMTSFTRIVIVLAILRQALGTMQTPSNQILIGLSLMLTFFIMVPVFDEVYDTAVQPYLSDELTPQEAIQRAAVPFRGFMLAQTREKDLMLFMDMAGIQSFNDPDEVPLNVLVPAFVISELRIAFQIGFMIFLPFLLVDLIVASVLMSLGMMMLSPTIVSLPFKLLLFVMVDGWALLMGSLAMSFA